MFSVRILLFFTFSVILLGVCCVTEGQKEVSMTKMTRDAALDLNSIMDICNSSFYIPMDYISEFNNTGALPNETDKTGMCYIRCFYEKSGLIKDWKLNKELLQQIMWPATGDSVEVCEQERKNESNACVRIYAIAKCLMTRAIVDARNKQVV